MKRSYDQDSNIANNAVDCEQKAKKYWAHNAAANHLSLEQEQELLKKVAENDALYFKIYAQTDLILEGLDIIEYVDVRKLSNDDELKSINAVKDRLGFMEFYFAKNTLFAIYKNVEYSHTYSTLRNLMHHNNKFRNLANMILANSKELRSFYNLIFVKHEAKCLLERYNKRLLNAAPQMCLFRKTTVRMLHYTYETINMFMSYIRAQYIDYAACDGTHGAIMRVYAQNANSLMWFNLFRQYRSQLQEGRVVAKSSTSIHLAYKNQWYLSYLDMDLRSLNIIRDFYYRQIVIQRNQKIELDANLIIKYRSKPASKYYTLKDYFYYCTTYNEYYLNSVDPVELEANMHDAHYYLKLLSFVQECLRCVYVERK